ncbi:MAG: hypothetical protein JXO72_06815 [Vicinamibacteria bacterium]|nr:hypothetical protein [Vicinamibacteria bacterium]
MSVAIAPGLFRVRLRLTLLLSIVSSVFVGFGLVLVPWTQLWESNCLLQWNPGMREFMLSAYVRGAVSGVGLVNVILAIEEIGLYWRHVHGVRNAQ